MTQFTWKERIEAWLIWSFLEFFKLTGGSLAYSNQRWSFFLSSLLFKNPLECLHLHVFHDSPATGISPIVTVQIFPLVRHVNLAPKSFWHNYSKFWQLLSFWYYISRSSCAFLALNLNQSFLQGPMILFRVKCNYIQAIIWVPGVQIIRY